MKKGKMKLTMAEIENKELLKKLQIVEEMLQNSELVIFNTKNNTLYSSEDFEESTPICLNGNAIQINLGMIE